MSRDKVDSTSVKRNIIAGSNAQIREGFGPALNNEQREALNRIARTMTGR